MLFLLDPAEYRLMPKCPFKLLTGLDCPGCGFQRATHAALHGRFFEAISYNYWLVLALPYVIAVMVEKFVLKGTAQQKAAAIIEHRVTIYFYVITFFVWFVARNIFHI